MNNKEKRPCQTPLEDLRKDALDHYDKASTAIHCFSSVVPEAINFYFDKKIEEQSQITPKETVVCEGVIPEEISHHIHDCVEGMITDESQAEFDRQVDDRLLDKMNELVETEKQVKYNLKLRGFTEEQILNNRGIISSTIHETYLMLKTKPVKQ